jgi:hypothetical protein
MNIDFFHLGKFFLFFYFFSFSRGTLLLANPPLAPKWMANVRGAGP